MDGGHEGPEPSTPSSGTSKERDRAQAEGSKPEDESPRPEVASRGTAGSPDPHDGGPVLKLPRRPGGRIARLADAWKDQQKLGWRLFGLVLAAVGVAAFTFPSGIMRNLLTALLVPGLMLLFFPPPWSDRRLAIIGIVLGVVGAFGVPSALIGSQASSPEDTSCAAQPASGTAIPLDFIQYRTDTSATFEQHGDEWSLAFPNLKWAGLFAKMPNNICRYRVDFEAKLDELPHAAEGAGWGYGSGVCNKEGPSYPIGSSLQYALQIQNGQVIASLLRVILPEANTYVRNATSNLDTYGFAYSHWTIFVNENTATWVFENDTIVDEAAVYGPDRGLPPDCLNSGLLLRGWGGTVHFRRISATAT